MEAALHPLNIHFVIGERLLRLSTRWSISRSEAAVCHREVVDEA
jgi:hypothetical protein